MKSARADVREPERWTARTAPPVTAEGAAGVALRRARDATEPREEEVARLHARLATQAADGSSRPWQWRLALALALLLATGGAVGAAGKLLRRRRPAPSATAIVTTPSVKPGPSKVPASPRVAPALPTESPEPATTAPPAVVAPRAVGRHEPTGPVTEARLLATAFRALRARRDAEAALSALDSYDREFPRGALAGEARIARVEALMALGRRADALALLAESDNGGDSPTRNVLVMRGELFAETGQCGKAVRDFDRILAASAPGDADARALFGRAACRLRVGDAAAGERDLRRYLDRYPDGAFAAAAREALQAVP